MNIDAETRIETMRGFLEVKTFQGDDALTIGRDTALLMEAIHRSQSESNYGTKDEQDAASGNYDKIYEA